ncbi:UNVERIFIED_CONTAM: hypothetical protein K2H54_070174 [Gekko kuhli]
MDSSEPKQQRLNRQHWKTVTDYFHPVSEPKRDRLDKQLKNKIADGTSTEQIAMLSTERQEILLQMNSREKRLTTLITQIFEPIQSQMSEIKQVIDEVDQKAELALTKA